MLSPLRIRRFTLQKTQDDIYKETGVYPSRLSRIERNFIKPTKQEEELLAEVLDSTVDELFPKT